MKTRLLIVLFMSLVLCLALPARAFDNTGEAVRAGQQKLQQKDYAGAQQAAEEGVKLAATPAERVTALLLLGQVADNSGDAARAREIYEQILADAQATNAQKHDALLRVANSWMNAKEFNQARAAYARALALPELTPQQQGNLQLNIARTYERQLDWPNAREAYQQCLALGNLPDVVKFSALCGVAGAYAKEKKLAQMREAVNAVQQANGPGATKLNLLRDYALLATEKNDPVQALIAWKQLADSPEISAKGYTEAIFKQLGLLAARREVGDARLVAEKAGGDPRLLPADRFLVKMISAGINAGGNEAKVKAEVEKVLAEFPAAEVPADAKVKAYQEAGKFFMGLYQYGVVREFLALSSALYRQEPRKVYACPVVDKAPYSVEGWLASPLFQDPAKRETRFEDYDRKAAELLITDVRTARGVGDAQQAADRGTAFAMAADATGWHIFVKCDDAEAERVAAGLQGGGQLEMYFTPGPGECYYQWIIDLPSGKVDYIDWNSPHRGYRRMAACCKTETVVLDQAIGTYLFIPWELVYDRLPAPGDTWLFGVIRWTRAGGLTWGGKVHEINKWGTIRWEGLTPERTQAIKRKLVMTALGRYQQRKGDLVNFWKDEVQGDPAFYTQALQPVVGQLDAFGTKVTPAMSATEVETLFTEAVSDWMEFPYKVAELRQNYLKTTLFAPSAP